MNSKLLSKILFSPALWFIICMIISFSFFHKPQIEKLREAKCSLGTEEDPFATLNIEYLMTRDPVTKQIPPNIHRLEQEFAAKIPKRERFSLSKMEMLKTCRHYSGETGVRQILAAGQRVYA